MLWERHSYRDHVGARHASPDGGAMFFTPAVISFVARLETTESMNNPILLCTVGGAHQPIIEAIGSTLPGYVWYPVSPRTQTKISLTTGIGWTIFTIKSLSNHYQITIKSLSNHYLISGGEKHEFTQSEVP